MEDYRLAARDEADLRWALCWAEGELGLRSNLGSTIACLRLGVAHMDGGVISTDLSDRMVAAASREKRVRSTLASVGRMNQAVLNAAYGPEVWKHPTLRGLSMVALLLPYVRDQADPALWLTELQVSGDMRALRSIRQQAECMLAKACLAYNSALRRSSI